jgi:hypothetical protein
MYKDSLSTVYPKKAQKAEFTGNRPVTRPRCKWEEGVKEDDARLLRCCNWKLTAQNRTVCRHKLWEAEARLQAVVPLDGCMRATLYSIRIRINPVKTQQFILLYSTICFGLKSHHQVEHKNTHTQARTHTHTHTEFIWNWDLKTSQFTLCVYKTWEQ